MFKTGDIVVAFSGNNLLRGKVGEIRGFIHSSQKYSVQFPGDHSLYLFEESQLISCKAYPKNIPAQLPNASLDIPKAQASVDLPKSKAVRCDCGHICDHCWV